MKHIFLFFTVLMVLLLFGVPASAQVLFQENFNYAPGQLTVVNGGNWTAFSGAGNLAIQVSAGDLTYTGYNFPGTNDGKITLTAPSASAEDIMREFTSQTSGTVYAAMLINVVDTAKLAVTTSSSGEYFSGFFPTENTTAYVGRLCIKKGATNGFLLGIRVSGSPSATWAPTEYMPGTTYLVVFDYEFVDGATNDTSRLWINPSLTGGMPAADAVSFYSGTQAEPVTNITRLAFRQGNATGTATPSADIDKIRVATHWAAAPQYSAAPTASNLTFVVNTATVPDTVNSSYNVVLVGSGTGSADTALTGWGSGKALTNIGGDYWKTTFKVNVGDTLKYKIRIGGGGWEKDLSDGFLNQGHRNYIVAAKDTTFPVQFWNNAQTPQPQYFRPWTAAPDSFINVYFRVNMQNVMNNGSFGWTAADKDSVGVRGGGNDGDDLSWGSTFYLKQEIPPGDGGGQYTIPPGTFFSGRLKFRKSAVTVGQKIDYKFLIGWNWGNDELQGGKPNRQFSIPIGKSDTTLQWVWYNNDKPIARANADTINITFNVDMTTAIQKQSFTIGDTITVQAGFFATADSQRTLTLVRQGLTNRYSGTTKIVSALNKFLDYQYYLHKNNTDIREYYFNFGFTGLVAAEQERRQISMTSKTMTISDNVVSVSDPRRQPYFENQRKLSKAVTVKWTVDLRPAYYQLKAGDSLAAIQGTRSVLKADSIKSWGVGFNGPAADPATGGWAAWDNFMVADTNRYHKMWDDGTHGDAVANDTIYTIQIAYSTTNTVGQVFKFGIGGSDNETAFGLNHLENIDDTQPTATLNTQFGSINPGKYNRWDFTNKIPTGVAEQIAGVAKTFALDQNYPNPFNPSTVIRYSIPQDANVTLHVYNLIGQQVATLVNQKQVSGNYSVTFDASKLSSGVYFYQINAGQFVSTKKMLLLK
ncbi:MAG: T9SS C-terminal target domain-containing protein [Ignavibacteriae bacterium]|nr:MAG: T9SS C-terminal target domain-containing protein [Ignavibacteriota bacterium]